MCDESANSSLVTTHYAPKVLACHTTWSRPYPQAGSTGQTTLKSSQHTSTPRCPCNTLVGCHLLLLPILPLLLSSYWVRHTLLVDNVGATVPLPHHEGLSKGVLDRLCPAPAEVAEAGNVLFSVLTTLSGETMEKWRDGWAAFPWSHFFSSSHIEYHSAHTALLGLSTDLL